MEMMRRKDRKITDDKDIIEILEDCKVMRVAIHDEEGLYIIPLNYGYTYENSKLNFYIHSAKDGRKVRAFDKNAEVAVELDTGHKLVSAPDDKPCAHGYCYRSITGYGKMIKIDNVDEKKDALNIIMKHQTGKTFVFNDIMAGAVNVYRLEVTEFTGKQRLK